MLVKNYISFKLPFCFDNRLAFFSHRALVGQVYFLVESKILSLCAVYADEKTDPT